MGGIYAIIAILSVIQILLSKYRVGKWIIPSITFLISLFYMYLGISFKAIMSQEKIFDFDGIINLIRVFIMYNTQTIICLIINYYGSKNERKNS